MKLQHRLFSLLLLAVAAFAAWSPGPAQAQGRTARDIPYATTFLITVPYGSNGNGVFSPDVVPLNKRLVIEFVSASVSVQPGDKPSLYLNDAVNGAGRLYWIPLTLVDALSGIEVYRASQLVKIYHDGNGANGPGAQCGRYFNTFQPVTCSLTISGYLVDK